MSRRMGRSAEDVVLDTLNTVALLAIAFVTLYPLLYVISMSISDGSAVVANKVRLLPIGFSLESYGKLLDYPAFWNSYLNTIWYTVVGTALNLAITIPAGYALSRRQFFCRRPLMVYLLITMLFSGGLIPAFILVSKLGLYNTRWAVVLPAACSAWNIMIVRVYLQSNIPDSLVEAAKIDGYNDIWILAKIVIPLSTTIVAIIALFSAVGFWNSYFSALIYLTDEKLKPIQLILMEMLIRLSNVPVNMDLTHMAKRLVFLIQIRYVAIVVSIIPILCMYPFLQKYFIRGVLIGAIKE